MAPVALMAAVSSSLNVAEDEFTTCLQPKSFSWPALSEGIGTMEHAKKMKFRKIIFSTETLRREKGNGTFPCGKFRPFRLEICIKTGRPLEQWNARRAGQAERLGRGRAASSAAPLRAGVYA